MSAVLAGVDTIALKALQRRGSGLQQSALPAVARAQNRVLLPGDLAQCWVLSIVTKSNCDYC